MARLPVVSGAKTIRVLGKFGYEKVGQTGSHVRLAASGRDPVTVPLHRELKRGTLRGIIRGAGLTVEEFNEAL